MATATGARRGRNPWPAFSTIRQTSPLRRVIPRKCNVPLLYSFDPAGKSTHSATGILRAKRETGGTPMLPPQLKVRRDTPLEGLVMKRNFERKKIVSTNGTKNIVDLRPLLLPIFCLFVELWR